MTAVPSHEATLTLGGTLDSAVLAILCGTGMSSDRTIAAARCRRIAVLGAPEARLAALSAGTSP